MKSEFKIDGPSIVRIQSSGEVSVEIIPVASGKMHTGILDAAIRSEGFGCTEELIQRMKAIEKLVDFQLTP